MLAGTNGVAVFLGNGDGTFGSPVLYTTSSSPSGLVAGDFNRDGTLDLAVATSNGVLSLLLGNGDGTFTLSNISPAIPYYAQGIAQADINGDGILDLIVASGSYNEFQVLLGNGDGTFTALTAVNATNYPIQVAVADFNQDGVPDIAIASTYSYAPTVYLGNGDGTFTAGTAPPFTGRIYWIAAADTNGDGIPDLVGTNISSNTVITLAGKGDGTFTNAATVSTGSSPEFVVAADWNGDGTTDLAVPDLNSSSVTVVTTQLAQTVTSTVTGISPDGTGSHTIIAKYSGDAAYVSSTSASTTLSAIPGPPSVTVTSASSSVTYAQSLSVGISVAGVSGDPIPTGTVTVSSGSYTSTSVTLSNGSVTIVIPSATLATGTDTLTVAYMPDSTSNGTYTSASGTASVSVAKLTPTVTVNPASGSVSTAATLNVSVTVTDSTGTGTPTGAVTLSSGSYTSSAATLSSGSASLTVPAKTLLAGQDTLSVAYTPDSTSTATYNSASGSASVTVTQTSPAITWATPAAITYGTALGATQLDATSTVPGTFVYSPASGAVLSAGNQTLSVTFTPTDTLNYSTATASVTLSVSEAVPTITWSAPSAITYGTALGAIQLDATSAVPGTFVYSPASGAVLSAGNQTLSVTFTPTDTLNYSTATASVTLSVSAAVPTITWPAPSAITYGTALSVTQLDATSSIAGAFSYTPALGTVLPVGNQTLNVTFTPTDSTDYATATANVLLMVNKGTPPVTWTAPVAITYGTALSAAQLNATSSVAGTFSYTPASGTVLGAGNQTLNVTFAPTDSTDYSSSTGTVSLTVNQATPSVTWTAPAAITYGTALSAAQLNATSSVAGTFSYTPASGTVLPSGNQTLNVTFNPTDSTDYATATASVLLMVNKGTPPVTWTAPVAITYGTALSAAQLNASSSVAGTFSYTPSSGTVLGAGNQTLNVTFTPTDSTDYGNSTGTVSLTVNKALLNIVASNSSRVYGVANPTFTGTVTGAVNSDTFTESFSTVAGISSATGNYAIIPAVTGTNAADYTITPTNGTLAITPASTTTTFALSNQDLTFTAMVATAVTGMPTGSVTFYQGQTSLGIGTLSNGVASLTLTAFPTGGSSLSAQYSGDANFSASTSAAVAVLAVSLGSSSLTVSSGGSVTDSLTIAVPTGYTGTVQLACSGLPQYATCTFSPSALSFTGTSSTATTTVTISTLTEAKLTPPELRPHGGHSIEYAMLFSLPGLLLCALGRGRRKFGSLTLCLVLPMLAGASASLCGCAGGKSGGGPTAYKSPTGTYSVLVTATGPGGLAQSTISLTVQ